MTKLYKILMASTISLSLLLGGCNGALSPKNENPGQSTVQSSTAEGTQEDGSNSDEATIPAENTGTSPQETGSDAGNQKDDQTVRPEIDLEKVKPNEAGKVMIVMFHRFIEKYESGDMEYVTTFDEFRNLLQTLYDKGYRLISMKDFLNDNIDVPAGCVPMVFTFDDGTPGQFSLVEEDGKLVVNKKSAVGVMMEFYEQHPDFGLEGTFYVNLGGGTFEGGAGTLAEKLKYLIDLGFEIGNHTYNHVNLLNVKTAQEVQMELGANQKRMEELVPGYKMETMALPLGNSTGDKSLRNYLVQGEYEGAKYQNLILLGVGADPTVTPININYGSLYTPRVRASGLKKVEMDLSWWLDNISRSQEYVSDGNPDTITVPEEKKDEIDVSKLGNKKLITY